MPTPASKVRALCTAAETKLVRLSRHPELARLSLGEVRRNAGQMRKLVDKWTDVSRGQSRERSRQRSVVDAGANTKLKAQIFREALSSFETRATELTAEGAHPGDRPKPPKAKKKRAAAHRATRATVRQGLAVTELQLNAPVAARHRKKAASKKPAVKVAAQPAAKPPAPAKKAPAKKTAAKGPSIKPAVAKAKPKKGSITTIGLTAEKRQPAVAAAKKSRLDRSGLTTRKIGHVRARGQRQQGRRDARS